MEYQRRIALGRVAPTRAHTANLRQISRRQVTVPYVIDGQQRLTSFFSFIDGQFPSGVDFHLKGLTVFAELNGKKYSELTETLQDQIRYFSLRTITFKREF